MWIRVPDSDSTEAPRCDSSASTSSWLAGVPPSRRTALFRCCLVFVRDAHDAAPLIARGARPQTSPLPLTREFNMRNPFSFAAFPSWRRVFEDKSKPAQAAAYRDRITAAVPDGLLD